MPTTTIITGTQKRSKDSFSSSPTVGLALRVNGEETPKVIDAKGNVYAAGIASPTVAPVATAVAGGIFTVNKWVAYVYVYASNRFSFVESDLAINGRLYPRSNQSPLASLQFTGANLQASGTVTKTTTLGITTIWLFRTAQFATQIEAETAAAAGQAFFVAELINDGVAGTMPWTDNNPVNNADQVQTDNYTAPQMQFAVFADPYWWGFGNLPFAAVATWDNSHTAGAAKITLTGADRWFNGRDGQSVTLPLIVSGGFDGNGTFKFLWLTSTTATLTINGITPVALPSIGAGTVTVQGPATTLYRSKSRNPFSWGLTEIIGTANVPRQYAFKVGGGMGTALDTIPNNTLLKLDCEYPAKCFTLNLRAAGTSAFEGTLRTISDVYSVSAHFSQFAAVTQSGDTVLWGLDTKNFAIVQCDGNSQVPISLAIPKVMRSLTTDRTRQLLTHGVYDPRTELNCMWVGTVNGLSYINYLICQHAPTGFWSFSQENDILSSATIQDTLTGTIKTFVGTQTGLLGQAFVEGCYNNFLPNTGIYTEVCIAATSTSLTITGDFNLIDSGLVGNWCLVTDATGQQEQWARISAVALHTITFDWIRAFLGGGTTAFSPVPVAGFKFFIGLIECRLMKSYDFGNPQSDKKLLEIWLTQQSVDPTTAGTLIRFYRERETGYTQFAPMQDKYTDLNGSDVWFVDQDVPSEMVKSLSLEIINRGYQQWRFLNMILKPRLNP